MGISEKLWRYANPNDEHSRQKHRGGGGYELLVVSYTEVAAV